MTEIAIAPKLPISTSNTCGTSSFGSQLKTSMVTTTTDCHNSEKSIVLGELETSDPNTTLASSYHSSSPPQRIPSVQQSNRPSGGYTTTGHQNVQPYSPHRTVSPTNQLAHQHYHHHYNHYHSQQHFHHQYPLPNRQQAAVRHLQEFMLQQWHNFECRNHSVRSCGNPCVDMKSKPYYNTPRYSQSKRDFLSTAESKHVSLPHSLPQGDRNSPIHISTKGPLGNQMISGPAMGETWTAAVPFYRRKLMSSSGNLSPTQQQSLRHSGSVDTMTWQRGYSNSNFNNNARMPPTDAVASRGPRFTSPARGHSAGSSSSSGGGSNSGNGGSTAGSGCRPSQYGGVASGGDDRTAVGSPEQEKQVRSVSARKDHATEVVASRCSQPTAHPEPHTILSRRPPDLQQHRKHDDNEDRCAQITCTITEPSRPAVADENSLSGVERPSLAVAEARDLETDLPTLAPTNLPARTDSQRPGGETVFSINTDKPSEDAIKNVKRSSSTKAAAVASQSRWQSDLVSSGGVTRSDESREEEATPGQMVCPGQQVTVADVTRGCYAAVSISNQPAASLPTVAISVNTVSSSVSSGDGLTSGEHFWTPDPPASPANTVATSSDGSGSSQLFSLAQVPASTTAVAALDSLNDVD